MVCLWLSTFWQKGKSSYHLVNSFDETSRDSAGPWVYPALQFRCSVWVSDTFWVLSLSLVVWYSHKLLEVKASLSHPCVWGPQGPIEWMREPACEQLPAFVGSTLRARRWSECFWWAGLCAGPSWRPFVVAWTPDHGSLQASCLIITVGRRTAVDSEFRTC